MRKVKDITGQVFNKLTAIKFLHTDKRRDAVWLFECFCGKKLNAKAKDVTTTNKRRSKKSCGCWSPVKKNFGIKAVAYSVYIRHYNDGDLTFDQFYSMCKEDCYYCGSKPSNTVKRQRQFVKHVFKYNGLDRIDNSLPHNHNNLVPCCFDCNSRKSELNFDEFLDWINKLYKHLNG